MLCTVPQDMVQEYVADTVWWGPQCKCNPGQAIGGLVLGCVGNGGCSTYHHDAREGHSLCVEEADRGGGGAGAPFGGEKTEEQHRRHPAQVLL
jgi:hypothetical protein